MKTKKEQKVYVNLGCGNNVIPSTPEIKWINIDKFLLSEEKEDFLEGDVLDIPLERESVDYIICDQVLEHLDMSDVPSALQEMKRILKKGGKLVIVVPDFRSAVKQWLAVDHDMCFNPYTYHFLSEVIYGNQIHAGEYHRTPMCPGFLNYALNMVGLPDKEIIIYPEGGPIPKYDGIRYADNAILRNAQLVAVVTK